MTESQLNYRFYKEHGICCQCGIYPSAQGRVRCELCLVKNAQAKRKKRNTSNAEYSKNLRKKRKENGLCIYCGKPQTKSSVCFCIDCKIKNQRRNEQKKKDIRSDRPAYGLCYRCGKTAINGKKLCLKCYEASITSLQIAALSQKTIDHRKLYRQMNRAIFHN